MPDALSRPGSIRIHEQTWNVDSVPLSTDAAWHVHFFWYFPILISDLVFASKVAAAFYSKNTRFILFSKMYIPFVPKLNWHLNYTLCHSVSEKTWFTVIKNSQSLEHRPWDSLKPAVLRIKEKPRLLSGKYFNEVPIWQDTSTHNTYT